MDTRRGVGYVSVLGSIQDSMSPNYFAPVRINASRYPAEIGLRPHIGTGTRFWKVYLILPPVNIRSSSPLLLPHSSLALIRRRAINIHIAEMEETNKDELDRADERLKEAEKREWVNEISDVLNARTSSPTHTISN